MGKIIPLKNSLNPTNYKVVLIKQAALNFNNEEVRNIFSLACMNKFNAYRKTFKHCIPTCLGFGDFYSNYVYLCRRDSKNVFEPICGSYLLTNEDCRVTNTKFPFLHVLEAHKNNEELIEPITRYIKDVLEKEKLYGYAGGRFIYSSQILPKKEWELVHSFDRAMLLFLSKSLGVTRTVAYGGHCEDALDWCYKVGFSDIIKTPATIQMYGDTPANLIEATNWSDQARLDLLRNKILFDNALIIESDEDLSLLDIAS